MKSATLLLLINLSATLLFAQADTIPTHKPNLLKKAIFPTTLIITGSLITKKKLELDIRQKVLDRTHGVRQSKIDDYFQFAPIAELYLADLLKVKAKNHWFDQSKNLVMTAALNEIIIKSLKLGIDKTRPNGGHYSMPSGHTSFAFANATVLYEEFKTTSPLIAYSGFGFAATTGTFRIINNKHWLSDVLVGTGIGILSAKIIYHFEPLKNWNPFKQKQNVLLYPQIQHQSYSVHSVITF